MGFLVGLNVSVLLNTRLSTKSMQRDMRDDDGKRVLRTVSGEELKADAVVSDTLLGLPFSPITRPVFVHWRQRKC